MTQHTPHEDSAKVTLEWASPNYVLLGIPQAEQGKALQAIACHDELLEACKFALDTYNNILTTDFEKGADSPARLKLEAAIAKAEKRE